MNRSRYIPTLLAAGTIALFGCATGAGTGGTLSGGVEDALDENEFHRSAEVFLTQAEALGAADKFSEALQAAMDAITANPENARGYYQAARAQVGLRDYAAADTLFNRAVDLFPTYEDDVSMQRDAAWIMAYNGHIEPFDAGMLEVAVERLEAAEQINPGRRPEALINLGAFYVQLDRADEAIDAFQAALDVIRSQRLRDMLVTEDSTMVRGWIDREAVVSFNRAQLLTAAERFDEAAAEYEAYLETYPDNIEALSNMAAVLSAAGRVADAQAIYDNLLAGANLGIRDYYNIGVGLYDNEDYANAAVAFGEVLEVSPQNRDALFNQVYSLYLAEDFDACVPAAMQLLDLDGFNRESHTTLGTCMARAGNQQEAVEHLCRGRNPQTPISGCESIEPLAFDVGNPVLDTRAEGGGTVTAEFTNNSLDPGTEVTVRVHFSGADGATVGTQSQRVVAPGQGETVAFQADLVSEEQVMGYYFQIIPPR